MGPPGKKAGRLRTLRGDGAGENGKAKILLGFVGQGNPF